MSKEVYLIGVCNHDLRSSPRVKNVLVRHQPDNVVMPTDLETYGALLHAADAQIQQFSETVRLEMHNGEALEDLFDIGIGQVFLNDNKERNTRLIYPPMLGEEEILAAQHNLSSHPKDEQEQFAENWKGFFEESMPHELAFLDAMGQEAFMSAFQLGLSVAQAKLSALCAFAVAADQNALKKVYYKLDTDYFLDSGHFPEYLSASREAYMDQVIEKICAVDGKTVYVAPQHNFFDESIRNPYDKLKERGIKVHRHRLIEFHDSSSRRSLKYQKKVEALAKKYTRESQKLIEAASK